MRLPALLALLVVTPLALVGCSSSTGGTASTSTPTSTGTSTGETGSNGGTTEHGAPKVKTPLDFAKSSAKPCGLLSAAQLQQLGMTGAAGKDITAGAGPACEWNDFSGASGQSVGFTFVSGDGGLDYLYETKDTFELFEPQPPVQGYPALLNSALDARKSGVCTLDVGLTDKQILTTTVQMRSGGTPAPRFAEPCVVAKEAVDLALTTIKGGS
ncbi:DUF3558 domain-containing protein [Umezawaea sp. NPDC059074]|uniref:DUF3558 domain-containing protein n=1 Tax=Umezawaea sp. NPDC059074 TaxID=3346716 RepID=UPI0036B91B46